ncbi:hypothetical protein RB195_024373 [Necator americanus]|uniref:Reverse transcriptase domain-containing protein n=1 Tax=Necator americanus TaxID=51031 RepID=A0ABR1EN06_NECAM
MITALRNPKGTTIASRREMEKIIYDFYSDLFYSHVYLPPYHLREDEYVIPEIIPSEVRHAVMSVLRELYSSFTAGISPFYKNIIIDVKKGIRQGDTISPKIFTATLENAMQQLERESEGGGRQLNYLRTADDIVQITSSISQAERMLTEFDETFGCIGLHLQKTIFIRNGWVSDAPYTLNGTNISKCTSYVYLGRELNMMNDLNPELGRRRRAAWGAYKSIEDVVKNTKNTRSPCSSRQHHCTSRFDIHAYGSMRISQAGRKRGSASDDWVATCFYLPTIKEEEDSMRYKGSEVGELVVTLAKNKEHSDLVCGDDLAVARKDCSLSEWDQAR